MIEKYIQGNSYKYKNGEYKFAIELIHTGILHLPLIGDVKGNLQYIRDGLKLIKLWNQCSKDAIDQIMAFFRRESTRNFFYAWATKENLIKQGFSFPGELTKKGEAMIIDIDTALEEFEREMWG